MEHHPDVVPPLVDGEMEPCGGIEAPHTLEDGAVRGDTEQIPGSDIDPQDVDRVDKHRGVVAVAHGEVAGDFVLVAGFTKDPEHHRHTLAYRERRHGDAGLVRGRHRIDPAMTGRTVAVRLRCSIHSSGGAVAP